MAKKTPTQPNTVKRAPIVVIMGHIDHGKSTLLDYIRKTNIVDKETGGITQHLSAYVVDHTTKEGVQEKITFLDTPGHAAFQKMRLRGADVADVAILIVSAEDGVMPQTLEALESIKTAGIPYIVAINKIDKPGADVPRTQASLIEHEIYLEGLGGDVPYVLISAKAGTGVDELLDLIVLVSDLAELKADINAQATGTIIEGHLDTKRGTTATMIVMDGTLRSGSFIVSGTVYAPVRIMEDFTGKSIREALPSTPIGIVGFSDVPEVGATFTTVNTKKEAEALILTQTPAASKTSRFEKTNLPIVPVLIKADVLGTLDAIRHELDKFASDRMAVRIIESGVGDITAADVQNVSATKNAIIVGFNVTVARAATELAARLGVEIDTFDIIYELSDWLEAALKKRTPTQTDEVVSGKAKILKEFSTQKYTHVLGGRMEEGTIRLKQTVRILRRDIEIGKGTVANLQQAKVDTQSVSEGEFGMQIQSKTELAPGDYIEGFDLVVT